MILKLHKHKKKQKKEKKEKEIRLGAVLDPTATGLLAEEESGDDLPTKTQSNSEGKQKKKRRNPPMTKKKKMKNMQRQKKNVTSKSFPDLLNGVVEFTTGLKEKEVTKAVNPTLPPPLTYCL